MKPPERAPQLPTDCHDQYSVRHSPLPREPPSSIVHPRAAPVTQRTLRYLRRERRHEVEEKNFFRLIDSKLARSTNPGPVFHTNESTDKKNLLPKCECLNVFPNMTLCHSMTPIATPAPLCDSHLSLANYSRPSYTHEPPPDG